MDRRRYLATLAAAAGTVAVAGCSDRAAPGGGDGSGGGGNSDTDAGTTATRTDDGTDTDTETAEPTPSAENLLTEAVGDLNFAGLALLAARERLREEGDLEFDPAEVTERTAAAREELDAVAARSPGEERLADVRALRGVADALDRVAGAVADLGTAAATLREVQSLVRERAFDAAADAIAGPVERTRAADDATTTAAATVADLDGDRLSELGIRYERLREGLASLSTATAAGATLAAGTETVIAGGQHLATGRDRADESDYGGAADAFAAASADLDAAVETYERAPDGAPDPIAARVGFAICRATRMSAAATHFENSAAAAASGDRATATEEQEAGRADLERAMEC